MVLSVKQQKIIRTIYLSMIKNKNISLFVHENPDFDALCSALALQDFLLSKKIDVRIVGLELVDPKMLQKIYQPIKIIKADDKFIKKSVGVSLDTANVERIFTQKHSLCSKLYQIDHHPKQKTFANVEWVDDNFSSTCEMIGWFIYINNNKKFTQRLCDFIYTGILTDTGHFMFSLANASTFELVSYFYAYNFNKQAIQNKLFLRDINSNITNLKLMTKIKILNNHTAYLWLKPRDLKKYQIIPSMSKAYLMNDVVDIDIWAYIYFDKDKDVWKVSIRSRDYDVRQIAMRYQGGGHVLASGFKLKTKKEVKQFIAFLHSQDVFIKANNFRHTNY